ncbi:MAG TPA: hypothetical protein VF170_10490 [Planctomycetaceae bacterium]
MTYRGHVKGGVVVLDDPVSLPEGSEVEVTLRPDRPELPAEQAALLARGRELVRRARERNRGVPADVLEHDVERAIDEVRGRCRP